MSLDALRAKSYDSVSVRMRARARQSVLCLHCTYLYVFCANSCNPNTIQTALHRIYINSISDPKKFKVRAIQGVLCLWP